MEHKRNEGYVIVSRTWYDRECMFLECLGLRGGERLSLLLIATFSWEILYILTRHASLRRSSRLRHSRCCSMSPTLDVLCCLLVTYLAALRWTISILLMSDLRWGSHTEQAYSSDGLTNDLYACSLTEVEPMFRLRRRKPRVLLALPQMLLMWLSHLRSSLIVTPRYFALSTDSKTWSWRQYLNFTGVLLREMVSTLHLSGWKAIFHNCSHCASFLSRSLCRVRASLFDLITRYAILSSAKSYSGV